MSEYWYDSEDYLPYRGYVKLWASRPEIKEVWALPLLGFHSTCTERDYWPHRPGEMDPVPGLFDPREYNLARLGRTLFKTRQEAIDAETGRWNRHIEGLKESINGLQSDIACAERFRDAP